jgi:hypothetical protein
MSEADDEKLKQFLKRNAIEVPENPGEWARINQKISKRPLWGRKPLWLGLAFSLTLVLLVMVPKFKSRPTADHSDDQISEFVLDSMDVMSFEDGLEEEF